MDAGAFFPRAYLRPAFFYNGMFISFLPLKKNWFFPHMIACSLLMAEFFLFYWFFEYVCIYIYIYLGFDVCVCVCSHVCGGCWIS
jgi:hypothetical protein